MSKKWINDAKKTANSYMDKIFNTYETSDYVEFYGKRGGDSITLRYYSNGSMGEK